MYLRHRGHGRKPYNLPIIYIIGNYYISSTLSAFETHLHVVPRTPHSLGYALTVLFLLFGWYLLFHLYMLACLRVYTTFFFNYNHSLQTSFDLLALILTSIK